MVSMLFLIGPSGCGLEAVLGRSWGLCRRSWTALGALGGGLLGASGGGLGAVLGSSCGLGEWYWAALRPSGRDLGRSQHEK